MTARSGTEGTWLPGTGNFSPHITVIVCTTTLGAACTYSGCSLPTISYYKAFQKISLKSILSAVIKPQLGFVYSTLIWSSF